MENFNNNGNDSVEVIETPKKIIKRNTRTAADDTEYFRSIVGSPLEKKTDPIRENIISQELQVAQVNTTQDLNIKPKIEDIPKPKDITEYKRTANITSHIDIEALRRKHSEPVRGIFRNYETPGAGLSFCFREFKGDPVQTYNLYDNRIHTIPYGVARHLNRNCSTPVHKHAVDEYGSPLQVVGTRTRRFSFEPLDFMDEGEFNEANQSLMTVQHY